MNDDPGTPKEIAGYGKVWNFLDAQVAAMFEGADVEIEEKVDGSQFSALLTKEGELFVRSKGVMINLEDPGMFSLAVKTIQDLEYDFLRIDYTYRFEFLQKSKHNTICYARVPKDNLILLDAEGPEYQHMTSVELDEEAEDLALERPPTLYVGPLPDSEALTKLLDTESFLGGSKIEGIVIKARDRRHLYDGKMLKAKIVSEEFKERHTKEWKLKNPNNNSVLDAIISSLQTEARYLKAVQSMRDDGNLQLAVQDIGPLMKTLGEDLYEEHYEFVKEKLAKHFWSKIQRGANRDFPLWYKQYLTTINS